MRHDFTAKTKETLARRVGYKCSNPKCNMLTVGPHEDTEKSSSIGVAAHIIAASENGPRDEINVKPEERKHITNGIWLCQSCSRIIDVNENKHPKKVLSEWKNMAELKASKELNQQLNKREGIENSTEIEPNGYYETKVGVIIVRYFMKNNLLHVESDDEGLISYVVLDSEGNQVDYKWPYELQEYSFEIEPNLILNKEIISLENKMSLTKYKLKWGKYVETVTSQDGKVHQLHIERGFIVNHRNKTISIVAPDFKK